VIKNWNLNYVARATLSFGGRLGSVYFVVPVCHVMVVNKKVLCC
jgi:hypothetical protein